MPRQTSTRLTVTADHSLTIERLFPVPRATLWAAFTEASQLQRWMGPRHCPSIAMALELRPGGAWRGTLRTVDGGRELDQGGCYREVMAPEHLSFTFAWDKSDGTPGLETLITVRFVPQGDATSMQFRQDGFLDASARDGHEEGWNSSFDRLAEHLARQPTQVQA